MPDTFIDIIAKESIAGETRGTWSAPEISWEEKFVKLKELFYKIKI